MHTIKVIKNMLFKFWIIIHFGKNPVKGGKPPIDRKLQKIINFKIGDIFIKLNAWLI